MSSLYEYSFDDMDHGVENYRWVWMVFPLDQPSCFL